jgi:hypothetical protein
MFNVYMHNYVYIYLSLCFLYLRNTTCIDIYISITIYIYIHTLYTYCVFGCGIWEWKHIELFQRCVPETQIKRWWANGSRVTMHCVSSVKPIRINASISKCGGVPLTNPGGFPPLTNPGGLPEMESSRCSHHNDSALASWQIILPAVSSECCHKTPCCGSFVVLVVWPILAPRGQGLHFRTTPWSLDSLVVISLSSSAWIPM